MILNLQEFNLILPKHDFAFCQTGVFLSRPTMFETVPFVLFRLAFEKWNGIPPSHALIVMQPCKVWRSRDMDQF